MGADLIGYMCIGPQHITGNQMAAAQVRAWDIFRGLREWYASEENVRPEILDGLDLGGIDDPCELESLKFRSQDITSAVKVDIQALVAEIVQFWNDPNASARDSVCRNISGTEKVVFCGEMSWGDEPSGYGYSLLKMVHVLDILEPLGIR